MLVFLRNITTRYRYKVIYLVKKKRIGLFKKIYCYKKYKEQRIGTNYNLFAKFRIRRFPNVNKKNYCTPKNKKHKPP